MDEIFTVLAALVVLMPVLSLAANIYLWKVALSDEKRPRSWILMTLAVSATLVNIASVLLAFLALRRFVDLPPLPSPLGLLLLGGSVLVLETVPLIFAVRIALVRRAERHGKWR